MKAYYLGASYLHKADDPQSDMPPEAKAHPIFSKDPSSPSVTIVTAERPEYQPEATGGNAALEREASAAGYRVEPAAGLYTQGPENSFAIYGAPEPVALDLARRYGQGSVIYSAPRDGGGRDHKFWYVNGKEAGTYHKGNGKDLWDSKPLPDGNWTKLPGVGYVRIGFDWTKRYNSHGEEVDDRGKPVDGGAPIAMSELYAKSEPVKVKPLGPLVGKILEVAKAELAKHEEFLLDLRKREGEALEKVSPPGRAHEVEELKAKGVPKSQAFAIAWKQHGEHGSPEKKSELGKGDVPAAPAPIKIGVKTDPAQFKQAIASLNRAKLGKDAIPVSYQGLKNHYQRSQGQAPTPPDPEDRLEQHVVSARLYQARAKLGLIKKPPVAKAELGKSGDDEEIGRYRKRRRGIRHRSVAYLLGLVGNNPNASSHRWAPRGHEGVRGPGYEGMAGYAQAGQPGYTGRTQQVVKSELEKGMVTSSPSLGAGVNPKFARNEMGPTAIITGKSEDSPESSPGGAPACPKCGGPPSYLGQLGQLHHASCRNCGWEYHWPHGEEKKPVKKSDGPGAFGSADFTQSVASPPPVLDGGATNVYKAERKPLRKVALPLRKAKQWTPEERAAVRGIVPPKPAAAVAAKPTPATQPNPASGFAQQARDTASRVTPWAPPAEISADTGLQGEYEKVRALGEKHRAAAAPEPEFPSAPAGRAVDPSMAWPEVGSGASRYVEPLSEAPRKGIFGLLRGKKNVGAQIDMVPKEEPATQQEAPAAAPQGPYAPVEALPGATVHPAALDAVGRALGLFGQAVGAIQRGGGRSPAMRAAGGRRRRVRMPRLRRSEEEPKAEGTIPANHSVVEDGTGSCPKCEKTVKAWRYKPGIAMGQKGSTKRFLANHKNADGDACFGGGSSEKLGKIALPSVTKKLVALPGVGAPPKTGVPAPPKAFDTKRSAVAPAGAQPAGTPPPTSAPEAPKGTAGIKVQGAAVKPPTAGAKAPAAPSALPQGKAPKTPGT